MSIRDSDVQRVREATDLVALIGRRVSLKRVGSRHVGLCPFHTEKTPSFSVDPAKGFYHCFGCKASGDAITFLRETEHLDFADAVEQLAAAANITLAYDAPGTQRANQRRKELLDLLERAARFYHEGLMNDPDAGAARAYLRRRGYGRDTVVKWRLGYAPPLWDELGRHLDAPPGLLAAAGLAYSDPASDFFRDRIMFPISDASGRVVSFAGRLLPRPDESAPKGPKYKNTAGTVVYDKSKVLYGLHLAKQPARKADRVVVCEGYTDVIGCDLAGIPEAVATCGTALTQQHADLLSRSAKRIVLAFDADAAGQTAAERVHQWEREYGLDIYVASLPAGSDPGDLAGSNPPALLRALSEAAPLRVFRAGRILQRADLGSPGGRDRAADEVAEVFAVYPPEVLLEADLLPAAQGIPMDAEKFRERVDAARRRLEQRPVRAVPDPHGDVPPPPDLSESYFDSLDGDVPPDWSFEDAPMTTPARRERKALSRPAPSPEQLLDGDLDLLAAALVPQGDTADLMVPELFATSPGRAAFERLQSAGDDGRSAGSTAGSRQDPDPVAEMLAKARDRAASLDVPSAHDLATTAMQRYVSELRRQIGDGGGIPGVPVDSAMSNTERSKLREDWLRWLLACRERLSDLSIRVAVADEIATRLRSACVEQSPASAQTDSVPAVPAESAD
ncbi:MAG: DNA primase [Acidimicrobiaceae bacterium]|nr:DNA primase [Acidimicrobiaceae bacterium]